MIVIIDYEKCDSCDGKGKLPSAFHDLSAIEQAKLADKAHYEGVELVEADDIVCPFCNGEGKLPVIECNECEGKGVVPTKYGTPGRYVECGLCKGEGYYVDRD